MTEKDIDAYIEATIIENHYIYKQKLASLLFDKYDKTEICSQSNASDYIEKWDKNRRPSIISSMKATLFKKKFRVKELIITGNDILFYDVKFFEQNQLIKIQLLLDKKEFESAIILIKRIASLSLLNQEELIKLFDLIHNNYPLDCIPEILDLIIINLEKLEGNLSLAQKQELLDKKLIPVLKKYIPFSIFIDECPYRAELNKVSKESNDYLNSIGGHITYNLDDNSKNDTQQKKYVQFIKKISDLQKKVGKFNSDINFKMNIRKKLIEIIAKLGFKEKIYNYLLEDIENYLPYVLKLSRTINEFNKLYSAKRDVNPRYIYIPNYTISDIKLNDAYNNKEEAYIISTKLANLIIGCYSQKNANLCFKDSEFDIIRRELISKYIEYENITNIIYLLVSK